MRILLLTLLLAASALGQEKTPAQEKAPATQKPSAAPEKAPAAQGKATAAQKTPAAPEKAPAAQEQDPAVPEKAPATQEKAPAATSQLPAQGPPPKNLTKLPDGHFSANSDPRDVENFEIHGVVGGDTLSGISKEVLKDGKLWPQIWEQNEHVVNPHWIYPNDKILIRPVTPISDAKPPDSEAPER